MRLLRLAPWRRGPLLLLRRPGVAVALLAAALVASLPAAAAPMFLSSAQHATLHRQIDETCQWRVGAQVTSPVAPAFPTGFRRELLSADDVVGRERYQQRLAALAEHPVPGLSAPVHAVYGKVDVALAGRELPNPDLTGLTLLAREGMTDQVEVLDGPVGEGVWLPDEWARQQGIRAGDELTVTSRLGTAGRWIVGTGGAVLVEPEPVSLPVAAVYRDLRTRPVPPELCGIEFVYAGTDAEQADPDAVILPTALVDTEALLATGETTGMVLIQTTEWSILDPELTASEADRLAAGVEALQTSLLQGRPELYPSGGFDSFDGTTFISRLDRFERRAELVRSGLLPPVLPITAAGTLVGLAVAGAAAVFWVQRRRRELLVLAGHGVSAAGLGGKAVIEALPAVLVGTVTGWAAAWGLVAAVGPSPVLAPAALPLAAAAAAATGLVALALVGRLAAAGARGLTDARPVTHRRRWWSRVPWELGLVAAAPAAWWLLAADQTTDPAAGGVGTVAHVPARLLVAPILIIAGLAMFAARLAAARLGRHRPAPTPAGGPAPLLARRRLVRAAAATAILAAATAVPVAMATFGAAATSSISDTADAQLRFNLGSDTVLSYRNQLSRELDGLPPPPAPPESLAATQVLRLNQARLGGLYVDVLAIDPETFPDGAYWDARIAGPDLATAVEQLTAGGGTPTVVASRRIPPGPATLMVGRGEEVSVQVAATRPLPGAQSAYPMVIIDRDVLAAAVSEVALDTYTPQTWIAGDPEVTAGQVQAAGLAPDRLVSIEQLRAGAVYEPVSYTFQYLTALSVFTGLIGAVGLLLYLESRTAAHRRAYVMLRRLGLSPGAHRRALLLEVATPVVVGLIGGIAAAVGLAYLLRSGFDLDRDQFPDALLALPVSMAGLVTAAAAAIALGAGLLTHARIARANVGEVLRDAS